MTTLELGVLIAAVVLVVLVWLIPLDRHASTRTSPSAEEPDGSGRPADEAEVAVPSAPPAAGVPVELPVPIAFAIAEPVAVAETVGVAAVAASSSAPVAALADPAAPREAPPVAPAHAEDATVASVPSAIDSQGQRTSTAKLTVSWRTPDASGASRLVRSPALGSHRIASTSTNPVAGGAESRSAYPMAIPIPVSVSVATAALAPEPAEPMPIPAGGAARGRLFESNSSASASVTWSPQPQPAAAAWLLPELRRGSQSIVARVSSIDPITRRNMALAAGAGVLLALAVSRR